MTRPTFRLRVLALLAALIAPALLRADAPSNVPQFCSAQTQKCTSCHGDVANECVLLSLDLGETTPWTGSMPVHLKVRTSEASPSLSTPSQLKLVLGYTFMHLGPETSGDEGGNAATFSDEAGRSMEFRFESGSSVGVPRFVMGGDAQARLQMVDAEGWATLSNPDFFDLYPGDGSVWRYVASPVAVDFGALARYVNPRGAAYTWDDMGVAVLRDASGFLRQVATRTRLADIVVHSATHYTVTVYPLTEDPQTDPDTGLLVPPPHDPVRVLDVQRGTTDRELIVGYQKGTGDMRTYRYVAKNGDWELTNPSGLVDANELYFTEDENGARRIHVWKDSDGTPLRRMEANFIDAPWGWAMTNFVEGIPGDATRTTSWSYFESGPHQGLVQEQITPTGNRIVYEYDDKNRVVRESMPLVEEETLYSYAPVDPSDPPLLCDTRPRCVVRTMQGIEIQRTYYVYGTNGVDVVERVGEQGAAYGGTNVLRTVTTYYPATGAITGGLVQSVRHEDGTIDNYTYDLTDGVWTETVTHVHEQAPDVVPMKTTRSVHVWNALGQLVDSRTDLCTIGIEDLVPQADWTPIERLQYAYDVDGNEIRREDLAGRLWTAEWGGNCCGKISETDWQGIRSVFSYDEEGRLLEECRFSPSPKSFVFQYDKLGRKIVSMVTNREDNVGITTTVFSYDALGRKKTQTNQLGITVNYTYDNHFLINKEEVIGLWKKTTTMLLDGKVSSVSDTEEGKRFFEYGVLQNGFRWTKTTIGVQNGPRSQRVVHDLLGRPVRTERPAFGGGLLVSSFSYDCYGRNIRTIESIETDAFPAQKQTERLFVFDCDGRLMVESEDINLNGIIDYSGPDRVFSNAVAYVANRGSLYRVYEYYDFPRANSSFAHLSERRSTRLTGFGIASENGVLIGETTVLKDSRFDEALQIYYDDQQSTITEKRLAVNGLTASLLTTRFGKLHSKTMANGSYLVFEYDGLDRHIRTIENGRVLFGATFDSRGLPSSIIENKRAPVFISYDAFGRPICFKDVYSNVVDVAYDSAGNPISISGSAFPIERTFNEFAKVTSETTFRDKAHAEGATTQWLYDDATGLVTNKIYADGSSISYDWTPAGKLQRRMTARGIMTTFTHSPDGKLKRVSYSDGTPSVTFEYNRSGLRTSAISGNGSTNLFSYSDSGLLTNEVQNGAVLSFFYDEEGHQTNLVCTAPFSLTDRVFDIRNEFDPNGRLAKVSTGTNSICYGYLQGADLCVTREFGTIREHDDYEQDSNLLKTIRYDQAGDTFSFITQFYDYLGRCTNVVSSWNGVDDCSSFEYDDKYQVSAVSSTTNIVTYCYDDNGNRTMVTKNGASESLLNNDVNQCLSVSNDLSLVLIEYDSDGNPGNIPTESGVFQLEWDGENRLVSASNSVCSVLYRYDAIGRLIEKLEMGCTTNRHRFLWRENTMLACYEETATDVHLHTFVWGVDITGKKTESSGIGPLALVVVDEEPFFPLRDGMGNVVEYIDSNGSVAARYEYDLFGRPKAEQGPLAQRFLHRYSSKPYDPQTSLYSFEYRFYNPLLGRWLNRDPIDDLGRLIAFEQLPFRKRFIFGGSEESNPYRFANNAPYLFLDILGFRTRRRGNTSPTDISGCKRCGKNIPTVYFDNTLADMRARFAALPPIEQRAACQPWEASLIEILLDSDLRKRATTYWDFSNIVFGGWFTNCADSLCGTGDGCQYTVEVSGTCYNTWEVNYVGYGYLCGLCGISKAMMLDRIGRWRWWKDRIKGEDMYDGAKSFATAGFDGWPSGSGTIPSDHRYDQCESCGGTFVPPAPSSDLGSVWPPPLGAWPKPLR